MPVSAALLCDAATVREGLLHVLGAGITRLWRAELPAPLAVMLAIVAEVPRETLLQPHELHIRVVAPDDEVVVEAMGGFQIHNPGRLEPGESQLVPQIVSLLNAGVKQYGAYRVEISLDSDPVTTIRFWVLHPEELAIPPITDVEAS